MVEYPPKKQQKHSKTHQIEQNSIKQHKSKQHKTNHNSIKQHKATQHKQIQSKSTIKASN